MEGRETFILYSEKLAYGHKVVRYKKLNMQVEIFIIPFWEWSNGDNNCQNYLVAVIHTIIIFHKQKWND